MHSAVHQSVRVAVKIYFFILRPKSLTKLTGTYNVPSTNCKNTTVGFVASVKVWE